MKKILFVCMGNICRSPAAEGILKKYVAQEGLNGNFQIDSAGLLDYHEGDTYDSRMIDHALKRGYDLTGTSRPFVLYDFEKYDLIIALDNEIFGSLKSLDRRKQYEGKIVKMTDFYLKNDYNEVPDPYYSGSSGFELVLDILENSCKELLLELKSDDTN